MFMLWFDTFLSLLLFFLHTFISLQYFFVVVVVFVGDGPNTILILLDLGCHYNTGMTFHFFLFFTLLGNPFLFYFIIQMARLMQRDQKNVVIISVSYILLLFFFFSLSKFTYTTKNMFKSSAWAFVTIPICNRNPFFLLDLFLLYFTFVHYMPTLMLPV